MTAFANWNWTRPALVAGMVLLAYVTWALVFTDWWVNDADDVLAICAIGVSFFGVYEVMLIWLGAPQVVIDARTREPSPLRIQSLAVHHLSVWNFDVPQAMRALVLRTAPEGCQVRVHYTDAQSGEPMLEDAWLLARWNDNREPVTGGALDIPEMSENRRLRSKLFPSECREHRNANPFTVAFAMKSEGEDGFYHFNDESYKWGGEGAEWKNPEWHISAGVYRVDVEVTGYGMTSPATAAFRLSNTGTKHSDCILEPWPS